MRHRIATLGLLLVACTRAPRPVEPERVCVPSQPVKSGTALTWFVSQWMDCDDRLACDVVVGATSIELNVTGTDPSPPWENTECMAMRYGTAPCAIPPMREGARAITLNGAPRGTVEFTPDGAETCDAAAHEVFPRLVARCAPGMVPPNTPFRIRTRLSDPMSGDAVCLVSASCHVATGAHRIELTHALTVRAGACEPTAVEAVCEVPGLVSGSYAVMIDGASEADPLDVGNGTETDCTLPP